MSPTRSSVNKTSNTVTCARQNYSNRARVDLSGRYCDLDASVLSKSMLWDAAEMAKRSSVKSLDRFTPRLASTAPTQSYDANLLHHGHTAVRQYQCMISTLVKVLSTALLLHCLFQEVSLHAGPTCEKCSAERAEIR